MSNQVKGYALGAIAAATYGMNPLFALPLYGIGMEADSVLLFRYLFGIIALAVMLKLRGHSFAISRRDVLPLAALGLLFSLSSLTLFESYNYMDAGIASTILFVYPLMVAGIMACCFGERITRLTMVCLVGALSGIALLYNGDGGATLSLTGTALVLGSALSYAIYIVGVNRSRLSTMPTLKITFYVLLFGSLLFVGRTACTGVQVQPADLWYMWGRLLALGLLPTAVPLISAT
ncbi:MAG: DMT family transporter, partial [Muribaculaceae bacterium]